MLKMIVITAIGNYAVEVVADTEDATNDDLLKKFEEIKNDVTAGCFMEGWTPDAPNGPPGVFSLQDVEVLAFHVERTPDAPPVCTEQGTGPLPFPLKTDYLGNTLSASCVKDSIGDTTFIFCYDVNGEPPTDVLREDKLEALFSVVIQHTKGYTPNQYLFKVSTDGQPRNFLQAVEVVEALKESFYTIPNAKAGKAWEGWKGGEL